MPHYIVKIPDRGRDWYLLWSTIVDAPVTYGMTLEGLRRYIRSKYGSSGLEDLPERLARVEAKGTSAIHHGSLEDTVSCNRAGKGETRLTLEQIGAMYCRGRDAPEIAGVPWEDEDETPGDDGAAPPAGGGS